MSMDVHFSSEDMTWTTPQALFDRLNEEFNFDVDVAALSGSAKCEVYFGPDHILESNRDALTANWRDATCFMNPPYGRAIAAFMEKAKRASLEGATVVCLIPSRTDTKWWHENVMDGAHEVRFIKGRVHFGPPGGTCAPFPSAIVVYRPGKATFFTIGVYDGPRKDVVE